MALFRDPIDDLQEFFVMIRQIIDRAPSDKDLYQGHTLDDQTPFAFLVSHPSLQCSEAAKKTSSSSAHDIVALNIAEFYKRTNDKNQILVGFDMIAQHRQMENFDHLKGLINDDSHEISFKYQLLHIACRYDDAGLLTWLLDFPKLRTGLDEHSDADYTPLLTATFYNSRKCINLLLQKVRP